MCVFMCVRVCASMCVYVCMCMCMQLFVCVFVGSCLATKVFIGNLPAMGKGVGHHKVGQ